MKFLVIVGTVRDGRKTIHAAEALKKEVERQGHETIFYDLKERDIPFLENRRHESEHEEVEKFGQLVENTDIISIVTPEYNHGIPGALKNALDHLRDEYEDKPFCYITVSGGSFGGVRAQTHLNEITLSLGGWPGPSLATPDVNEKFDSDGNIVDEKYRDRMERFVSRAVEHADKFRN
ncbi:MAG: NADPH-dependent FMN reductase [Candidatus Nanohaloarchaea archaeon]